MALGRLRSLLARFRGGVALTAASAAERGPVAGLIAIDIDLHAHRPRSGAVLSVSRAGERLFEKRMDLPAGGTGFWIALHGHLLPPGSSMVEIELSAAGRRLAEKTLVLHARNAGALGDAVADSLRRAGAPAVLDGVCDSGVYDYADPHLKPWFDREPAEAFAHIDALAAGGRADADEAEALRQFVIQGFLTLPDVLGADQLSRLNAALDDAVAKGVDGYAWGSSERIHGLHERYPAVRELWLHPKVLKMLDLIFDAPARPCQSLTYVFGSQQEHHQDTIHLTPFPAGYMCGVWTALEDVREDSGELMVFPGSHRLPRVYTRDLGVEKVDGDWKPFGDTVVPYWSRLLEEGGFSAQAYRPKAGSILIWHENLMHGGSVRRDLTRSRRSIVCHYFAEGSVAYYDSSGTPGVMHLDPRG